MTEAALCHCGEPAWEHDDKDDLYGNRGMCRACDIARCDTFPARCPEAPREARAAAAEDALAERTFAQRLVGRLRAMPVGNGPEYDWWVWNVDLDESLFVCEDEAEATEAADALAAAQTREAALRTGLARMTFFRDETERQFQRAVEQINSEYSRAETAETDLAAARDRLDGDAWDRITAERDALRAALDDNQSRASCCEHGWETHHDAYDHECYALRRGERCGCPWNRVMDAEARLVLRDQQAELAALHIERAKEVLAEVETRLTYEGRAFDFDRPARLKRFAAQLAGVSAILDSAATPAQTEGASGE